MILSLLFWFSLGLVIVTFVVFMFQDSLPAKFVHYEFKSRYYNFLLIGGPIAAFMSKIIHYLKYKHPGKTLFHFMVAGSLATVLFTVCFIANFGMMDNWVDDELMYVHHEKEETIVRQLKPFSQHKRVVCIKPFTKYFMLVTPVETSQLSLQEWQPVPIENRQIPW